PSYSVFVFLLCESYVRPRPLPSFPTRRSYDLRPRFGQGYRMPIIYAGNRDAAQHVRDSFDDSVALMVIDNVRPVLERENLGPARDRKSTRLNSSHVKISYAVFCLKKKIIARWR